MEYNQEYINKMIELGSNIAFSLDYRIQQGKKNNEKVQKATDNLNNLQSTFSRLEEYYKTLQSILKVASKEDARYRESRLNYLSNYIDSNLAEIFPEEGFKTNIPLEYKYGKHHASLQMYNNKGILSVPKVSDGKCCQQLISFSAGAAIVECLGSNKLYMDEALSAASAEKLHKIGMLINNLINKGFQIILIEQRDDVYKDIPRREFTLYKNPITKETKVVDVKDY